MSELDDGSEVTRLLKEWSAGDPDALDQLLPLVFDDLRKVARRFFRHQHGERTLQPTALVNEVYVRMAGYRSVQWQNSRHFFLTMAGVMQRLVIDLDRRRMAAKRGGDFVKIPLDETLPASVRPGDLVALDDALQVLKEHDPRQHRIVQLKFFGGLTLPEIADVLEVARSTVIRDWSHARAWLLWCLDKTAAERG